MAPPLTLHRVDNSITHQPLIFIKKSAKSHCNRLLYNIEIKDSPQAKIWENISELIARIPKSKNMMTEIRKFQEK